MKTFHAYVCKYEERFRLIRESGNVHEMWNFQEQIDGEGYIQRLRMREGLELVMTDYRLLRNEWTTLDIEEPVAELMFYLEGDGAFTLNETRSTFCAGSYQLLLMKETRAEMMLEAGKRLRVLGLRMTRELFHQFVEQPVMADQAALGFDTLLGGRESCILSQRISPQLLHLIDELLVHAGHKRLPRLYLESKSLELLWLAMQDLLAQTEADAADSVLRAGDRERILQARALIEEHMRNPPSLQRLARMIGMNDYKLKRGFKEVYGTTVYGMLRELRLERACQLLEYEAMNVCETALAVGYANPGYFAEAFRERYGITPRRWKQARQTSVRPYNQSLE